ncbi:hypothetical protein AB4T09_001751 [Salmonella enterica]|nr:hypothetical protein [Salmonella enterica]ECU9586223.1 hypothetical protein [Salmonella enterica subsp. enterica serovar Gaminara]EDQ6228623.1 hypothetical protein [Salmonella enterica subsp. enterica serovar Tucson]EDR6856758.1 hypothetical protein [Salmonella enterica subsp. enterica]EAT1240902.1 hypothetical protein [Salmonella enterica]
MKKNCSVKFESKFNYENNNGYHFNKMLKRVLIFIHHGHGLTLEEVRDNTYIQNFISFTMSLSWRKRHAQFNFIKMLASLPEPVSLDIIRNTHEMYSCTEGEYWDDKEKEDWCNAVITYIGRVDKTKTESDLKSFSFKMMGVFNAEIYIPCQSNSKSAGKN